MSKFNLKKILGNNINLLFLLIIFSFIVLAAGSQYYQSYKDNALRVITSYDGTRYGVTSSTYNHFIPNNNQAEWNAFYAKASSGQLTGLSICTTVDCTWTDWILISRESCDRVCGGGYQLSHYYRDCNNAVCGGTNQARQYLDQNDYTGCNSQACCVWTGWYDFGNADGQYCCSSCCSPRNSLSTYQVSGTSAMIYCCY